MKNKCKELCRRWLAGWRRRADFRKRVHFINKAIKKYENELPALSAEQVKEIEQYWARYGFEKVPLQWHRFYYGKTGQFRPDFIPAPFFYESIKPAMNDVSNGAAWSDKSYLDFFLRDIAVYLFDRIVDSVHDIVGVSLPLAAAGHRDPGLCDFLAQRVKFIFPGVGRCQLLIAELLHFNHGLFSLRDLFGEGFHHCGGLFLFFADIDQFPFDLFAAALHILERSFREGDFIIFSDEGVLIRSDLPVQAADHLAELREMRVLPGS